MVSRIFPVGDVLQNIAGADDDFFLLCLRSCTDAVAVVIEFSAAAFDILLEVAELLREFTVVFLTGRSDLKQFILQSAHCVERFLEVDHLFDFLDLGKDRKLGFLVYLDGFRTRCVFRCGTAEPLSQLCIFRCTPILEGIPFCLDRIQFFLTVVTFVTACNLFCFTAEIRLLLQLTCHYIQGIVPEFSSVLCFAALSFGVRPGEHGVFSVAVNSVPASVSVVRTFARFNRIAVRISCAI